MNNGGSVTGTSSSDTGSLPLLVMGEITGAHGLEGNIKVRSFAQAPDLFAPGSRVFVSSGTRADAQPFVIDQCVPYKKGLLMRLAGIKDRNMADALIEKQILVPRSRLPEPEENAWYWEDLYGLTVTDEVSGDLGTIDTIFSTGAHDILVVKTKGRELLIPMHRQFVMSVDIENARVVTRLPEGYDAGL
ncbi:MAG: ribosome maturation factor RimM [Desulfotignum sp.]|nr:ribosome maturation factor RimM [Desulfotignum sp.]MCF8086642.1 ribosome maturation factor RimM [Desulfotignum sp.]MCF8137344.1 ribosome maturation factor RimM [Desulfotignum sp.]